MERLKVIAVKGMKVPVEGKPTIAIPADKPVSVPNTRYYRRRLKEGGLKLYRPPRKAAPKAKTPEADEKKTNEEDEP